MSFHVGFMCSETFQHTCQHCFLKYQSKEAGVDALARITASAGFQAEVQNNTFINGNNEWTTFQSSVSLLHTEHDLTFKLKENQ